jgi:RNA polymerase sigma factor (sigma-70 family)
MTLINPALLADAADGNAAARERLLSLCAPVLLGVARRTLSRNYAWDVEDAEQVARLSCIDTAAGCRNSVAFPALVATDALHNCLRERRLYHRGWVLPHEPIGEFATLAAEEPEECDVLVASPEVEALVSAAAARVREMVDHLPEPLRVTLIRRYGLDGSTPETQAQVARALGVARKTVNEREARALRILREKGGLN